jgi:B12 binding protein
VNVPPLGRRRGLRIKMILPALTEATSPFLRPIKYSLFPPLGLATLAGYTHPDDEVAIHDEHVEQLTVDDRPDLVVIQIYITSARRSYAIADYCRRLGSHVALGGLHVTSLPDEAAQHADTVLLGPGEDTFPQFLDDLRDGAPGKRYVSQHRTLIGVPPIRRDLIQRTRYLVPNSIVVSRGCPHVCDFCYKAAFFKGGKQFYTQQVDDVLREIDRLPGPASCISSTTTCSAIRASRRPSSTGCGACAGSGRLLERSRRFWNYRAWWRRPLMLVCAVCSSGSRP